MVLPESPISSRCPSTTLPDCAECVRKLRVDIGLLPERLDLLSQFWIGSCAERLGQLLQHRQRFAALGQRECLVEGDDGCSIFFQLVQQERIISPGQGE